MEGREKIEDTSLFHVQTNDLKAREEGVRTQDRRAPSIYTLNYALPNPYYTFAPSRLP
jgi:hypothetical protein